MEWIIYGFFGVLGTLVLGIVGYAFYYNFFGKGKDLPSTGPKLGAHRDNPMNDPTNSGGGGQF